MMTSPAALSKSAKRRIAQQNTARNRKPLLHFAIACCLFMLPADQPGVGRLFICTPVVVLMMMNIYIIIIVIIIAFYCCWSCHG